MEELDSGIVYINLPTSGAEIQLPFGGTKQTGNGHREAGWMAMDYCTEWKSIYVNYSDTGDLVRAQIDTVAGGSWLVAVLVAVLVARGSWLVARGLWLVVVSDPSDRFDPSDPPRGLATEYAVPARQNRHVKWN